MKKIYTLVAMATFLLSLFCSNATQAQNVIQPGYCAAGANNGAYPKIDFVGLGNIYNYSGLDAGYEDFTYLSTDLYAGSHINAMQINNNGGSYEVNVRVTVFIDFNHNYNFDDAGETIYANYGSGSKDFFEFAVPANAVGGPTRMRVRTEDPDNGGNNTPCGNSDRGQVEDYTVNIIAAPCQPTSSETTVTECNSYTWNGVTYYNSGDKTYTTTNAAGCDSVATLHLTITSIANSVSVTNAGCYGSATGAITMTPTSGFGPYYYRIGTSGAFTPGGSSYTFSNLKAGTYRTYVQDATGCIGVAGGIVISQSEKVSAIASSTPASCYGTATGTITIDFPAGIAPFKYKLGSGGVLTSFNAPYDIVGVAAGNYGIYITDANGCNSSGIPVTVSQPAKVSATLTATDVTGCNGNNDGTLTISSPIGNSPFMYKMTSSGTYVAFTAPYRIVGLTANNYSLFIQDAKGCVGKTNLVTINQPAPVPVSYTVVQPTCSTLTGSITLSTNNTLGATYKISSGSSIYTSQNLYSKLATGTYYGYAKDAAGCTGRSAAIVLSAATGCSLRMARGTQQSTSETTGTTLSANISPNPSRNVFKLTPHTSKTEAIQLRVIDVNGKVVYTAKGSPTQTFTFGEALTVGVYMIELRQGNEMKIYKVVKTL